MINAEKYKEELKENGKYFAVSKSGKLTHCSASFCDKCIFCDGEDCYTNEFNWLLEEYKEPIKLTRFEYDFLNHLDEKWTYVYRAGGSLDNNFVVTNNKPQFINGIWINIPNPSPCIFSNRTFGCDFLSFIENDYTNAYKIGDILENCEVEE